MAGLILLAFTFSVAWAGNEEKCKGELGRCLAGLPMEGQGGLPVTAQQIESLCKAYQKGMECVGTWKRECLPSETRKVAERQMASAQLFMGLLCSESNFKKEYLNHTDCFGSVSSDWERCNIGFKDTVNEINSKGTTRVLDLCCARYGFNRCISLASRAKCDHSSAVMLRRISETLSSDKDCENLDVSYCSANSLIFTSFGSSISLIFLIALVVWLST